jgi:transcription initiation factor TFIIIB Brf1 subunit/transcription initiation factor TFIIB
MVCQNCKKLTSDYQTDKLTCASCREVFKIDLVCLVLELDPIYLSERTRNKTGRPRTIRGATARHDIRQKYQSGVSIGKLAKEYKVGRTTIHRIIHSKP